MSFFDRISSRSTAINSLLCVGLDPHSKELDLPPAATEEQRAEAAYQFCKRLIDATSPHAVAYKPNAAFFEALGTNLGCSTLRRVVDAIPDDILVLLDVKRGDIGSTAAAYAEACYDGERGLKADGVTLSPLMGWDSVAPFVTGKYSDKGAFVLCKTSNPGSNDLLALNLQNQTLFEKIAELANEWSQKAESESPSSSASAPRLGLVVGATDPSALSAARKAAGQGTWILAPGVGAQGGDLDAACRAGLNDEGGCMLIPVSRGVSRAADPAAEALKLKEGINIARAAVLQGRAAKAAEADDGSDNTSIQPYQKEFIEFALKEGVLKFGSFVLKSGRTSPYFFNAGLFSSGSALSRLGRSYAAAIMASELVDKDGKVTFDVVFGPAYKGISLGALVCAALYSDFGVDVGFAYNRKEAKDHGEGGILVGASMSDGKRVLIVDDVITAGTAIRESFTLLTKIGASPVGVAIALDRAEKRSLEDPLSAVQAVARDLAVPVVSIAALPQLQEYLKQSPDYGEDVLNVVTEYRSKYGV